MKNLVFFLFLFMKKNMGLFGIFDERMKMMMKMKREEDDEMLKKKIRCW